MNNLQWYDYLRLLTSLLAVFGLYFTARNSKDNWWRYTRKFKETSWVYQGFLFLAIVGPLEQVASNVEFGYRVICTFALTIAAIRASLRKGEYLITLQKD